MNRDNPIFGQGVPPSELHIFITGDGCARLKCDAIRLDREENLLPVWGDEESSLAPEEAAPEEPEIAVPEFGEPELDLPSDAHREPLPPRLETSYEGPPLWSWKWFSFGAGVALVLGLALIVLS